MDAVTLIMARASLLAMRPADVKIYMAAIATNKAVHLLASTLVGNLKSEGKNIRDVLRKENTSRLGIQARDRIGTLAHATYGRLVGIWRSGFPNKKSARCFR